MATTIVGVGTGSPITANLLVFVVIVRGQLSSKKSQGSFDHFDSNHHEIWHISH
jgi:hypothetical protein